MVRFVTPQVIKIAETFVDFDGLCDLMEAIKHTPDWVDSKIKLSQSDAEFLIEVAGRMCYKSFGTSLNPNLTKVREDTKDYIGNILKSKHGSVLEHASVTFALVGISRIVTHEIVRHRAGVAYSQESMRFVRIDNMRFYLSDTLREQKDFDLAEYEEYLRILEKIYKVMSGNVIKEDMTFFEKKQLTSALRRMLPDGICTDLVMTANHRAWRHMIEMRTSLGAEEEIRKVFLDIANQLAQTNRYLYQDMLVDDTGVVTFENSKI